jgi:hypothetical protein
MRVPVTHVAARVFGGLSLSVVAFQLALASGAPWGHLTMGGAFTGRLPTGMRVAAVAQAFVLSAFAVVVAARAQLMLPRWYGASRKLVWVVVAYMVVGVVLNTITPSGSERAVWLPVTLVLLICAIVVARGGSRRTPWP